MIWQQILIEILEKFYSESLSDFVQMEVKGTETSVIIAFSVTLGSILLALGIGLGVKLLYDRVSKNTSDAQKAQSFVFIWFLNLTLIEAPNFANSQEIARRELERT